MTKAVIAIDGPAGAGKSTIAKLLAKKLGLLYIDTGAMYRALALKVLRLGIMPEEMNKLADLASQTSVALSEDSNGNLSVLLDGEDVTDMIRTPEVTMLVSSVALIKEVRMSMVEQQRIIAQNGGVVMDGRDIGTFVFPQAELKFFLTADIMERAKRRYLEMSAKGVATNLESVAQDLLVRDSMDENRALAPLKAAEDAIVIDTTGLGIDDVITKMMAYWSEK